MIKETMISTVGLPAGGYAIRPKTGFGQMKYRTEHDSVGDKNVPEDAYYGVQTLRAVENFRITGLQMHPEIISSLAYIKKAAASTNCEIKLLDPKISGAIVKACEENILSPEDVSRILDPVSMTEPGFSG